MKQSKKSAITRQKILDAAEQEFAQNGFSSATIDAIATSAGVNKQLIYAHFQNKENLYSITLERVYSKLSEFEESLAELEFQSADAIRTIVEKYFSFLTSNPIFVRLMLWENLNGATHVKGIRTNLFVGSEKLIRSGMEKGILRSDIDASHTAMSINMFCFSAFSNVHTISALLGKDLSTTDELKKRADHIADIFTKYMLSTRGSTPVCLAVGELSEPASNP